MYIERNQLHRLHVSFNEMLGRGRASPTEIDESIPYHFFCKRIADVRAVAAGAAPSVSFPVTPGR